MPADAGAEGHRSGRREVDPEILQFAHQLGRLGELAVDFKPKLVQERLHPGLT